MADYYSRQLFSSCIRRKRSEFVYSQKRAVLKKRPYFTSSKCNRCIETDQFWKPPKGPTKDFSALRTEIFSFKNFDNPLAILSKSIRKPQFFEDEIVSIFCWSGKKFFQKGPFYTDLFLEKPKFFKASKAPLFKNFETFRQCRLRPFLAGSFINLTRTRVTF